MALLAIGTVTAGLAQFFWVDWTSLCWKLTYGDPKHDFFNFDDFSIDYIKRFLVIKRLRNSQSNLKIGANDSEWTCATILKKSDSGKIFKNIVFSKWFWKKSSSVDFWKVCSESVLWRFWFPVSETIFRKPVSGICQTWQLSFPGTYNVTRCVT